MQDSGSTIYRQARGLLEDARTESEILEVTGQFHHQVDQAIVQVQARAGVALACGPGCHYCCHLKVDVQPAEVFPIIDYLRDHFSLDKIDQIQAKAAANWKRIEPMDIRQHLAANLPCALLEEGKCSIYPVRPSTCRACHARHLRTCLESFEHPENFDLPGSDLPEVRLALSEVWSAFSQAYADLGYDIRPYDLNGAINEALANSRSRKTWLDKGLAFSSSILSKDYLEEVHQTSGLQSEVLA